MPDKAPSSIVRRWPGPLVTVWRVLGWGLFCAAVLALVAIATALVTYAYYAASLPPPHQLHERAAPFKSTKIYDRGGRLLSEVIDPFGGRRTMVDLKDIPHMVIDATVATEDATFFSNPGLSAMGIVRALYLDLREGEMVYGGSTITQQLVKNLYLTHERTLSRKIKEAILAAELSRRYSKEEVLETYLNEVYFGNLAYGIGAAAETYFGKQVSELTLPEAALLVGMIQSPAHYDPYARPESALARRTTVLRLMRERGYISQAEFRQSAVAPLSLVPPRIVMRAPHMVMYVREQLEGLYGTEVLYRGGLNVYTTLDLELQQLAEEVAREKIAQLRDRDAGNAALIAMDSNNGDILAMLGSVDFYDAEIDGQVNVALALRQPGSTIKPFTYLAAMERGWSAATMLMDVEQDFPDGANPPYVPHNYDEKEWGAVSVRTALACSRNIPAVSTLEQVGIPALLEVAQRLGIRSLNRSDYGLSLTLGGGEVTLSEMVAAYAALANGGHRITPRAILRIEDQEGRLIMPEVTPDTPLVMDPRHAYILTDILSDEKARIPAFGPNSALRLSRPSAVKTGTTNDYLDSWTIGYTPSLVTGVWVGNCDNRPMRSLTGARGAALIWHDFMEGALTSRPLQGFVRPPGLVDAEVCPVSGKGCTDLCPPGREELFLAENSPQDECGVHRRLRICKISGKLASDWCPEEMVVERVFEDYGPQWDEWAKSQGINVPPREVCSVHKVPSHVAIDLPPKLSPGILEVWGSTQMAGFAFYVVEYSPGPNPTSWQLASSQIAAPVRDGVLCRWDARELPEGVYSVRVVVSDHDGNRLEARTAVDLVSASPKPTQRVEATDTPLSRATATAVATVCASPSATMTSIPTQTATPRPTKEPSPSATFTAVPTSTPYPATSTPLPTMTEVPTPTPSRLPTKCKE